MRPNNLKTRIFLDGGDPNETKQIIKLLGFLDGQTTNPTLISKNPQAIQRLEKGEKFTREEILNFYKKVVQEISVIIPEGSVSIEVPADKNTLGQQMLQMGKEMFGWISNAHIKYPSIKEGLKAAAESVKLGIRVNMTLCFTQEQAAAVYAATRPFSDVFVSPFIGRLDDLGENGMDLNKNILKMYQGGDHHVSVLTASVRNMDHFLFALSMGSDIITAPYQILKQWAGEGLQIPGDDFVYDSNNLKSIPYQELDLNKKWQEFNIIHGLTDLGVERFSSDWNNLIKLP